MTGSRPTQQPHGAHVLSSESAAPYADLLRTPASVPADHPLVSGLVKYMPARGADRVLLQIRARTAYEEGAAVREVAQLIGRSYGATYALLVESGVVFRQGGRRRGKLPRGLGNPRG